MIKCPSLLDLTTRLTSNNHHHLNLYLKYCYCQMTLTTHIAHPASLFKGPHHTMLTTLRAIVRKPHSAFSITFPLIVKRMSLTKHTLTKQTNNLQAATQHLYSSSIKTSQPRLMMVVLLLEMPIYYICVCPNKELPNPHSSSQINGQSNGQAMKKRRNHHAARAIWRWEESPLEMAKQLGGKSRHCCN